MKSKVCKCLICISVFLICINSLLCYVDMDKLLAQNMPSGGQVDEALEMWTGCVLGDDGYPLVVNVEQYEAWMAASGRTQPNVRGYNSPSVQNATPPAPKCSHEYTVKQTKAPNCTEEGENTYTCTKCGNTYTEPIPVNGAHNYSAEETTKPTCTESGEVTYTCIICGDTYTEPVEAIGHDYSSEQTKAPTCTEEGEITYTCKNCGDTYTEPVAALGHTPSEWTVTKPASLWVHGETIKTCLTCGEVLETKVIESTLPVWTLYAGIGVIVVLIVVIVLLIKRYKRLRK